MDSVFEKWREKLLDAGKGNKLINYKDTSRTIDVLAPEFESLFHKISNGETLTFYDVDTYIRTMRESELEIEAKIDGKEIGKFDRVTKQQIINNLTDKIKKNQILAFKKGATLQKTLKSIRKVAIDSLLEKGINVLYMAFGFLKWKEKEESDIFYRSPLILIPISLDSTESKDAIFSVVQYEDEINTNPTLSYVMKNEFGLAMPEYQDENNSEESLTDYFNRVQALVSKKGWDVNDNVAIGTFSFLKMNMYKDLEENESKILKNINIKKLLNRQTDEELKKEKIINIDDYFKEGRELSLHNVVDADSSQMQAIIQAQSGKSFVLQGPPGTGKSQTITNLIAEFLYNHKKVLFVSEKLEALNVVYNNLKKVGLEDFCLELHSHKTNKKEVISELYRVLNKNKTIVTTNADDEIQELKKSKKQLDEYNIALHTIEPVIERTPYQIIGAIEKYNDGNEIFEYAIPSIEEKGIDYLKDSAEMIDNYSKHAELIGFDYHQNAWYGFEKEDINYSEKLQLKKNLNKAITYLEDLKTLSDDLKNNLSIELSMVSDIYKYTELFKAISVLNFFDKNIFIKNQLQKIYEKTVAYNKKQEEINTSKNEFEKIFSNDIYEININDYYLRFKNEYILSFRFFNSNYRRDFKVVKRYLNNHKSKLKYNDIVDLLRKGKEIQSAEKDLDNLESSIISFLDNKEQKYNWKELENELSPLVNTLKEDFEPFLSVDYKRFINLKSFIKDTVENINKLKTEQVVIDELQKYFNEEIANLKEYDIDELIEIFTNCLNDFDNLENWIKFAKLMKKFEDKDLVEFIDKSIENNIEVLKLENTFKLMFYTQWMYYIISKNETLHNFTRVSQDSAVQNFRKKDKLKFEIAKAEIVSKLSSERPSINTLASGSQVSTLVREAGKKRKQKPVRILLSSISELVQTLKPCFLMSPLSVSTYLSGDSCKFDVVIFDEASQIFPWDAIGAIYRAKQVIVVGDSKQMPPSNYFNAEISDDSDDENYEDDDSLDFESILDLCATSFNQQRLSWHYRSRTEDLINFSNKNFYDGTLITFPSASKDNTNTGVDFYYVERGVFDRKTKTNIIEANKVVDLVFEHFKTTPERSLGVVAFSISQQNVIESIIQERREKDDKYAEYFDSKKPERFFVKNLETVQGDERDTIIFSVAYAKDKDGKFLHNFGPLNRKGGERRLNVAVTRAKYNVKLVSSIKGYDIDLGKTKAVGAKLLKEYLEYAESGMQNISNSNIQTNIFEADGVFEDEVYNTLTHAGYIVTRNVGCSEYKIDLGVKHPTKSDYVLAIECDGNNYHSGRTTRDRDRLRQEVLEKLGWKFYRVWSTDWFTNRKVEKKRLLDFVAKTIENFNNKENVKPNKEVVLAEEKPVFILEQESIKKDLKSEFKEYEIYDIYDIYNKTGKPASFNNVIYNLVKTEAPITEELLLKRTVGFWGNEKVTNVVRYNFANSMRRHPEIKKIKDYYVVDVKQPIEMRIPKEGDSPRDILLIPNVELSSGIRKIIEFNVGINKDGLFRTIANLLGFTRIGDNIRSKLEEALDEELKYGTIKEIDGEYFIK